ncbi:MAG: UDP-3-O-(3-hydroxymyristoyl)glucosamine N-acyltransferase [Saprospiraceae bacterium]|nr:UDP-3-O-(3-hydroxymyristoyl)glucosamine N-acyltransferase [Saprospiraceae bacterium]
MLITAKELCDLLGGELEGNPDITVDRPSKIEEAEAGSLSFLANPKYEQFVYQTRASVLLVNKSFTPRSDVSATLIRVEDVYESLGILLEKLKIDENLEAGISDLAYVHPDAVIGENAAVGPFAVVSARAVIGDDARIYPQVFVGQDVQIGAGTKLYPGVKVYHGCVVGSRAVIHANSVIGSDGFGFARAENGVFSKIAQVGNVVIEDEVEIGSNTVIDRATMGSTVIRRGVKLDNLIQVAHNVEIGENSAMAAQSGVAGSTRIGKNVLVGGQAGFVGHIQIADDVQIQAQSGIAASVKERGARLYGSPALDYMDYLKSYAVFRRLPELQQKINELEKTIKRIQEEGA